MFLYCLFMEGTMKGDGIHNANDDCAICRAWTKRQAIRRFSRMYSSFADENVFRVKYNRRGIAVLSDY